MRERQNGGWLIQKLQPLGLTRVINESSIVIQPSLRNWPRVRVTVSRVVQAIEAISSWVSSSGKRNAPSSSVLADLVRELEQQASQATGNGFSQRNAACILQSEAVLLADALHGAHLGFFVAAQKVEKSLALDGAKLRRSQRLRGDLIHSMGKHCVKPSTEPGPATRTIICRSCGRPAVNLRYPPQIR